MKRISFTELTDRLAASYAKVGGINHVDGVNLPSKTIISHLSCQLLRLLFPGFFDDKPIHSSELKIETALLMDEVKNGLEDEIAKSIVYRAPGGNTEAHPNELADEITCEAMATKICTALEDSLGNAAFLKKADISKVAKDCEKHPESLKTDDAKCIWESKDLDEMDKCGKTLDNLVMGWGKP